MLKLQGNNQDAGKVQKDWQLLVQENSNIEMFLSNLRVTAADFGLPGKSLGGFGIPHSSSDESWKTNTKVKDFAVY